MDVGEGEGVEYEGFVYEGFVYEGNIISNKAYDIATINDIINISVCNNVVVGIYFIANIVINPINIYLSI